MTKGDEQSYPWFGVPPAREPKPSSTVPALIGKRLILSTPEGFVYDMRAGSDPYVDEEGQTILEVVSEEDYFRWMFLHEQPRRAVWEARFVWVE